MLILSGNDAGVIVTMGVLCSSWIAMNRGTSKRTWLNPHGDTTARSVILSNMLTARPISQSSLFEKQSPHVNPNFNPPNRD